MNQVELLAPAKDLGTGKLAINAGADAVYIGAARFGARVTLIEYHGHLGGMSASGLGKSDIENKQAIAGLFKEFTQRILKYYMDKYGEDSDNVTLCKEGYYYEPSVAELVFNQMIVEDYVDVFFLSNHLIKYQLSYRRLIIISLFA